jgi:hypothetical protein
MVNGSLHSQKATMGIPIFLLVGIPCHGGTRYRDYVNMTMSVPTEYFSSWSFQFEDDRLCFLLAWSHLEYKANRCS